MLGYGLDVGEDGIGSFALGSQRVAPLDDEIARFDHLHGDRVLLSLDVEFLEILGPAFFLRGEVAVDPAQSCLSPRSSGAIAWIWARSQKVVIATQT